jgi:hypothetical protein
VRYPGRTGYSTDCKTRGGILRAGCAALVRVVVFIGFQCGANAAHGYRTTSEASAALVIARRWPGRSFYGAESDEW